MFAFVMMAVLFCWWTSLWFTQFCIADFSRLMKFVSYKYIYIYIYLNEKNDSKRS